MDHPAITGTLVWYHCICPREAWLMARQIEPERDNDLLAEGRYISENTYSRQKHEITLPGGVRVDTLRREQGRIVLGEIKKSSRYLHAATMQMAYYLHLVREAGLDATGEVLVPEEKLKHPVVLEEHQEELNRTLEALTVLLETPRPPKAQWIRFCPKCAYAEFCWSGSEVEE